MYDQSSVLIAGILFVTMIVAMEVGYRVGHRLQPSTTDKPREHVNAVQSSLLGILALLLAFTFSLALQRFDSRSEAVVDEANAIGTAYLRAQLLPAPLSAKVQQQLRDYVDLRVREGSVTLSNPTKRNELLAALGQLQNDLWQSARRAVEEDPRPVTTGLFIPALNDLIDAFGRREAGLNRHVPEIVLFLLYGVFLVTVGVIGFSVGVAGHRPSIVSYILVALIVLLVFIIIDLDRPRRGLIEVNRQSLFDLQAAINADSTPAQPLP